MSCPATPGRLPCCGRRQRTERNRAPEAMPPGRVSMQDLCFFDLELGRKAPSAAAGPRSGSRGQSRSSQAMSQKEASYREQAVKISSSSRSWTSV